MQSRDYYYRTLVGIGTNEVGVATNLVLFSNTVYNGILGIELPKKTPDKQIPASRHIAIA